MKLKYELILFMYLVALAGCSSTTVSYKDIHYGLYWHKSPYINQASYHLASKDFLKKRGIKWGDSYSKVKTKVKGIGKDFHVDHLFSNKVNLFPEITIMNIRRKRTKENDKEKFEEADIFSKGEARFYNDKLYEITFTYSRHDTLFGTFQQSKSSLRINSNDPALHGMYHIYEYMKLLLKEKYGIFEEKNYWNIEPQKQEYFKAHEEIGRSFFQNCGQNFIESVWKRGKTEIRLLYLAYGYGTVRLHYWNPELRNVVAKLEQKRKYEQVNKHF